MSADYFSLYGQCPSFDSMDLMLISTIDTIKSPKTRALFRSIAVAGVSRTSNGSMSVVLSFPSKLIRTHEYEEPRDFGQDNTHG
jgi:hypothetical protein